jgi:hypothetical protein
MDIKGEQEVNMAAAKSALGAAAFEAAWAQGAQMSLNEAVDFALQEREG